MTKNNRITLFPARQIVFGFMSVFSLALILRNSDIAVEYMSRGLSLCAEKVIPSLFPFMIISALIVKSGVAEAAGKLLSLPMRFLFGTNPNGACAVILGAVCGFPVGAASALGLYDEKKITRRELEHLLTFSNIPSSAFLISTVGGVIFGSRRFGVFLYSCTLVTAAIIGISGNIIYRIKGGEKRPDNLPQTESSKTYSKKGDGFVGNFTAIIAASARNMLTVCAFVVFFTAFVGCLSVMLDAINPSPELSALIFGFFELTGGVAASGNCAAGNGAVLAAFIAGWSGLSVHFQIMSLCDGKGISFKPYFFAKAAHGILNAIATKLYFVLFRPDFEFFTFSVPTSAPVPVFTALKTFSALIFLISVLVYLKHRKTTL